MAPKTLRQVTRKSAVSLPAAQTAKFLLKSALNSAEDCPQLAAVLGRKCLQTASGQHGAVSRAQASSLCNHCGMPQPQLTPETAHPIKLSRTACRRNRRHFKISQAAAAPAEKAQKSSFNRAALVMPCQFCGYKTIKQFYTVAAAQHAAKIETSVGEK